MPAEAEAAPGRRRAKGWRGAQARQRRARSASQERETKAIETISISAEEQARMHRAASRQRQIDSGNLGRSGAGVHGGGHRAENRRDRQKDRQAIRAGRYD